MAELILLVLIITSVPNFFFQISSTKSKSSNIIQSVHFLEKSNQHNTVDTQARSHKNLFSIAISEFYNFCKFLSNSNTCLLFFFIFLISSAIIIKLLSTKTQKRSTLGLTCYELSETSKASTFISPMPSPSCSASNPENPPFGSLFSHNTIDGLIDNQSFNKNFYLIETLWDNYEEKGYLVKHKLDSQIYLVKGIVMKVNLIQDIKEQKIFKEINKVKQIGCRHIARYVTCWIESDNINFDSITAEVILYVQMEYVNEISLKQWLHNKFDPVVALKAIRKIAKGLKYVHDKGIAHGNISLENIFINKYDNIVIGDFNFKRNIENDLVCFTNVIHEILTHFSRESVKEAFNQVRAFEYFQQSAPQLLETLI